VVSEDAGADSVWVVLDSPPVTDVVVVVASDETAATVGPSQLRFTRDDWAVPRSVAVSALDDPAVDGDEVTVLTLGIDAAASDSMFHGIPDKAIEVTTVDDDYPGLVVGESGGFTLVAEQGTTDDLTVALAAQPLSPVVLRVSSDDPEEATVAPSVLTFAPADWSTPQVVTVEGVDDSVTDGAQTSTLTLSVDADASDDAFDGVTDVAVLVTTLDGDFIGVSSSTPTGHPSVPSDALVAAYDMTTLTPAGLLQDFSGRGLDGIISGTVVEPSPRGGARVFDVATDRIELPARNDFDLDGPLTLVTRVRMDLQRRHQHILACDDKFAFTVREADQVRLSNSRGDLAETLSPLPAGIWHSLIGVVRGTAGDVLDDTNIEIWIDGVRAPVRIIGSAGSSPAVWRDGVLHPTDACYIGFESHQGDPSHQNLAFHGAIDEVVVFGRALTPQEIELLAQSP
jgi:hypothetical protein